MKLKRGAPYRLVWLDIYGDTEWGKGRTKPATVRAVGFYVRTGTEQGVRYHVFAASRCNSDWGGVDAIPVGCFVEIAEIRGALKSTPGGKKKRAPLIK